MLPLHVLYGFLAVTTAILPPIPITGHDFQLGMLEFVSGRALQILTKRELPKLPKGEMNLEENLDAYYIILDISKPATKEAVRESFKNLVMKWHPDRHTDPADKEKATEHMQRINATNNVLEDGTPAENTSNTQEEYMAKYYAFHAREYEEWYDNIKAAYEEAKKKAEAATASKGAKKAEKEKEEAKARTERVKAGKKRIDKLACKHPIIAGGLKYLAGATGKHAMTKNAANGKKSSSTAQQPVPPATNSEQYRQYPPANSQVPPPASDRQQYSYTPASAAPPPPSREKSHYKVVNMASDARFKKSSS